MASTMNNGQFTLRKTKMICKVTVKLKKNNKFIKIKKFFSYLSDSRNYSSNDRKSSKMTTPCLLIHRQLKNL